MSSRSRLVLLLIYAPNQNSPFAIVDQRFVARRRELKPVAGIENSIRHVVDDFEPQLDDDVVEDAMHTALSGAEEAVNDEDDDDEEQIVWNPR
jgi:hypothetical protein